MAGIQETKEVLVAVNELAIIIVKQVKDGIQISDLSALMAKIIEDGEFKAAIAKAIENVALVPVEIADLSLVEKFSLAKLQIDYIPEILEAFKK